MLEKINDLAEKVATNVSQSRRGFLARVGQAALGAAGAVGGLLASPSQSQAGPGTRYCMVFQQPRTGAWFHGEVCLDIATCRTTLCPGCLRGNVVRVQSNCGSKFYKYFYDPKKPCPC